MGIHGVIGNAFGKILEVDDMAQAVNVNFKLDSDIKKSMEDACAEMGLTMSAAFTIYAKKVGRERRIPFEITADAAVPDREYFYPQTEAQLLLRIDRSLQQIKDGRTLDARQAGAQLRDEFKL